MTDTITHESGYVQVKEFVEDLKNRDTLKAALDAVESEEETRKLNAGIAGLVKMDYRMSLPHLDDLIDGINWERLNSVSTRDLRRLYLQMRIHAELGASNAIVRLAEHISNQARER